MIAWNLIEGAIVKLTSLTAIFVVRRFNPPMETVQALADSLAERVVDFNIIIVANGVDQESVIALNRLPNKIPDLTIIYIAPEQHDDVARLLGIDQAIGDYILLCTPTLSEISDLDKLFASIAAGNDIVVGKRRGGHMVVRGPLNRLGFAIFRYVFKLSTGCDYPKNHPAFHLLSRTAALNMAGSPDAEVLIRRGDIGPGFARKVVELPDAPQSYSQGIGLRKSVSRAIRLIATTSSLPIRLTSYISILSGFGSLIYAVFVVGVWTLKRGVAPGWTSLSLQISGMWLLMSVMFFLMAEYLMHIFTSLPSGSRRHLIAREVSSQSSRRKNRLNVVDALGQFQIGIPDEYAPSQSPLEIK
jgi:hypothetical protein